MPAIQFPSLKRMLSAPVGTSLMALCEENAIPLTFGCGSGACGTCRVRITENPQNLSAPQQDERDFLVWIGAGADERLACQCRIQGDFALERVE